MACEKYSGWMTAAALGELGVADQAELRAHAAGCGDCRRELDGMSALVAAVDRGVEALIAGEPSPQFAARLRARIAEEPSPSAWWALFTSPRLTVAALAAAAVLLAVVLVRTPERSQQPAASATRPPSPDVITTTAGNVAAPERNAVSTPSTPRHTNTRAQSQATSLSMEVLVPRGQISAALILSEGVSAGTIDGAQLVRLAERSAEPLELKALEIQPLAVPSASEDAVKAAGDDGDHN